MIFFFLPWHQARTLIKWCVGVMISETASWHSTAWLTFLWLYILAVVRKVVQLRCWCYWSEGTWLFFTLYAVDVLNMHIGYNVSCPMLVQDRLSFHSPEVLLPFPLLVLYLANSKPLSGEEIVVRNVWRTIHMPHRPVCSYILSGLNDYFDDYLVGDWFMLQIVCSSFWLTAEIHQKWAKYMALHI